MGNNRRFGGKPSYKKKKGKRKKDNDGGGRNPSGRTRKRERKQHHISNDGMEVYFGEEEEEEEKKEEEEEEGGEELLDYIENCFVENKEEIDYLMKITEEKNNGDLFGEDENMEDMLDDYFENKLKVEEEEEEELKEEEEENGGKMREKKIIVTGGRRKKKKQQQRSGGRRNNADFTEIIKMMKVYAKSPSPAENEKTIGLPLNPMSKIDEKHCMYLASKFNFRAQYQGPIRTRYLSLFKTKTTKIPHEKEINEFLKQVRLDKEGRRSNNNSKSTQKKKRKSNHNRTNKMDNYDYGGNDGEKKIVGENSKPIASNNVGFKMLQTLGWKGNGVLNEELGGLENPLEVEILGKRKGLGWD